MAQQVVNVGTAANAGDGDPLREAFNKLNANDAELYAGLTAASETAAGIVELATTAETTTATDTARAVTPAGIGAERAAAATLTNKTLTSPTINGGALSGTFSGTATFSGVMTLSAGTTSFSSSTGTLILSGSGGIGVGGNIYAGNAIVAGGALNGASLNVSGGVTGTGLNISGVGASVIQFLSGNDSSQIGILWGRAAGEHRWGVSGNTNDLVTGSAAGDQIIRTGGSGKRLLLGANGSGSYQVSIDGALTTIHGTLKVGSGGATLTSILSATASLDFPSVAANGRETLTITVTGASAGDSVFLGVPAAAVTAGVHFSAVVTAANTVTVYADNFTGSASSDIASGTFRATVFRI